MPGKFSSLNRQTLAKFAAVFSGLVFGIYWIPIRAMDASGFTGLWPVALLNLASFVLILPLVMKNWGQMVPGRLRLQLGAFFSGLAYVLYAGAFLYTEVIRVIVLFYLMPIWGFLVARIVTGDPITGIRWVSMMIGLLGLVVICGTEQGMPLPSNPGDWMALIAGMIWAVVSLAILMDRQDPVNYTIGFLFWSTVCALVLAMMVGKLEMSSPDLTQLGSVLLWLIPFALIVVVPAAFATMYGPSQLNPGVVGLLFMTEISVGTVTAALWAGEPFGSKEILGVLLITLAGIAEPAFHWMVNKRLSTKVSGGR